MNDINSMKQLHYIFYIQQFYSWILIDKVVTKLQLPLKVISYHHCLSVWLN